MADRVRKQLVWDIKRELISLPADELFRIAKVLESKSKHDASELDLEDSGVCFDHINAFMSSELLLETEDQGMSELLSLQEMVKSAKQICTLTSDIDTNTHPTHVLHPPTTHDTFQKPPHVAPGSGDAKGAVSETDTEIHKMLAEYEAIGRKIHQYMTPTQNVSLTHTLAQGGASNTHMGQNEQPKRVAPDYAFPMGGFQYIQSREFKIHGGQIGDHSSDITFNNVCRQIDSGLKENFSNADVVRGVLRIIKPGIFKDMLMNKDDMTVAELKGFLQSHLGDRNSTELFQELMCTKQSEHETPQQFLYRVMGLKQKILFAAKQADSDRKYSAATVQDVFLHTVYQGLSHRCKDIRSELRPLLADSDVTDDAILRHVMKITSDENERLRRLGPTSKVKQSMASSAQVSDGTDRDVKSPKATPKGQDDPIKHLTARIDALTSMVDAIQHSMPTRTDGGCQCSASQPSFRRVARLRCCPRCADEGRQDCTHCFICGEDGHRAVGCLRRPQRQGNGNRPL